MCIGPYGNRMLEVSITVMSQRCFMVLPAYGSTVSRTRGPALWSILKQGENTQKKAFPEVPVHEGRLFVCTVNYDSLEQPLIQHHHRQLETNHISDLDLNDLKGQFNL